MKKFKFNLQKVLDYKITLEEKKKDEFALAQRELTQHIDKLEELEEKKEKYINNKYEFKTSYEFQGYIRYLDSLNNSISMQRDNVSRAEEKLVVIKNELLSLMSERKIIERLREKALLEYQAEEEKIEQRFNDDYAIFSYIKGEGR